MYPKISGNEKRIASKYLTIAGLGLAFLVGSLSARAQQNRDNRVTYDQQDSQRQGPPGAQSPGPQGDPNQLTPPQTLTLPAGTTIRVRIDEWLSSDRNLPGDSFSAILEQPVVVDGWVVARRGQSQTGRVTLAKKAGRVSGTSQLGVELDGLTLVDGQQMPLQTQLFQTSAGTSHGKDAATIGTTTGAGAVIGAIADGGAGAAIGAGAGAAAGIIGVLGTRGKSTVIAPETVLSFRLQSPVTISTERSQFAFQPVTQDDFDSRPSQDRPRMQRADQPPPPPPYYYGYPYENDFYYPYAYYPAPFSFGFYGGEFGYGRFGGYRGGGYRGGGFRR